MPEREKGFFDVKVLFQCSNEGESLEIVGNEVAVKSAIMALLCELARYQEISLTELLLEFVEVARIKEKADISDMLADIMEHLGIERE